MRQFLDHHDRLNVTEASLQLHVRHKVGTAHAYMVRFKITKQEDMLTRLGQDLKVLVDLLSAHATHGKLTINDNIYYAIEISDLTDPSLTMIDDDLKELTLPHKVEPVIVTEPAPKTEPILEPVGIPELEEDLSLFEMNQVLEQEEPIAKPEPIIENSTKRGKGRANKKVV